MAGIYGEMDEKTFTRFFWEVCHMLCLPCAHKRKFIIFKMFSFEKIGLDRKNVAEKENEKTSHFKNKTKIPPLPMIFTLRLILIPTKLALKEK